MKVPANLSGDRLILDYLARVTEAGLRYLPKGARMAFVGRTRMLIEQECGQAGRADPARVMEVLTALGEPEELVRAERARIDAEWAMRRSRQSSADGTATVAGERPPASSDNGQPAPSREPPAASRREPPAAPSGPPEAEADTQPLPRIPAPWWAGGQEDGGAGDAPGPGTSGPFRAPVPGRPSAVAATAWRLARRHPWESAAVALLGVGGVILPFPFWLFGWMAAIPSRLFDIKDKWIALMGPVVTAVIGTVVVALAMGGHGNPAVIYFHALGLDTGVLLRVGSVICAAHLARRVHRGPRVRVPPWRR